MQFVCHGVCLQALNRGKPPLQCKPPPSPQPSRQCVPPWTEGSGGLLPACTNPSVWFEDDAVFWCLSPVDAQISAAGWQSERMLAGNPRKLVSDLSQSCWWCRDTLHHTQAWHRVFPAAWHRLELIGLSRNLQSVLYCLRGLKSTVKFQYSYQKTCFLFLHW